MKNTNLGILALVAVATSAGCLVDTGVYVDPNPNPNPNTPNPLVYGTLELAISEVDGYWVTAEDEFGQPLDAYCYNSIEFGTPSVTLDGAVDVQCFHPSTGEGSLADPNNTPFYTTVDGPDLMVRSYEVWDALSTGYMSCDLYHAGTDIFAGFTDTAEVSFPADFIYESDCDGLFRSGQTEDTDEADLALTLSAQAKIAKGKITKISSNNEIPKGRKVFASLEEKKQSMERSKARFSGNRTKALEATTAEEGGSCMKNPLNPVRKMK